MQVIETQHAFLTAYEVSKVVEKRLNAARPYNDSRDKKYLGEFKRVEMARKNLFISLNANAPEPLEDDPNDDVGKRIVKFVEEIQKVVPGISSNQIRDLIAYRPTNSAQINAVFSSQEEWDFIAEYEQEVIDLVNTWIPRKEKIISPEEADEEAEADEPQAAASNEEKNE